MALAFGVIVADGKLPAWQQGCLERLADSRSAELRLGMVQTRAAAPGQTAYEQRLAALKIPSLEPRPLERVVPAGVKVLTAGGDVGSTVAEAARELGLDFILNFAGRAAAAKLTDSAPFGVWSFDHGELGSFSSPAAGFWEIYLDHAVTGASLVRLGPDGSATVLRGGYLATARHSLAKNIAGVLSMLAEWPAMVCRDIIAGRADYLSAAPQAFAQREYGYPSGRHFLRVKLIEARCRSRRYLASRCFLADWNIGVLQGSPTRFIGQDAPASVERLYPKSRKGFLADPFVVQHRGTHHVLCENFEYRRGRGVISAAELAAQGYSELRTILEAPSHLSYPQVFGYEGELYCLPESVEERKVQLFKAVRFPNEWTAAGPPLIENFAAVDSTIARVEERWWLFCTNLDEGYHSHLYLWHADDLLGPWTAHCRNPVKIDARSAGPAGPLFWHEGRLYRPAQDCSRSYGQCIHLNQVRRLTATEFVESVAGTVRPPRTGYRHGIHTLSGSGDVWMVDVLRPVFNPKAPAAILRDAAKAALLRLGVSEQAVKRLSAWVRRPRRPLR